MNTTSAQITGRKLIAADIPEPQKGMYGTSIKVLSSKGNQYKVRKVSDSVKVSYEIMFPDEKVCFRDSRIGEVKRFLSLV
jgi:hypothetical protein